MVYVIGIRFLYLYLRKVWMWLVYGEYVEVLVLINLIKVDCISGMGRNLIFVNRESVIVLILYINGKCRLFLYIF